MPLSRRVGQSAKRVAAPAGAVQDGRVRRGARNRQVIVEALLELVGSGVLRPTAQQVADRAGVGIRTVFRHFSEMESLYQAMNARVEGEVRPLITGAPQGGSWEDRARGLVRQRATFFERIAPYKRAGNLLRWRSRFLQDRHRELRNVLRADLLQWLPELDRAPSDLVHGIELATSFETWDALRGDRQLSLKQAAAVVERSVLALLRDRKTGR
jgi:AcrR family transcriptional regulator